MMVELTGKISDLWEKLLRTHEPNDAFARAGYNKVLSE